MDLLRVKIDMKRNKKKTAVIKLDYKKLIRPMFTSTIMFGYATEKQVNELLDNMFKKDSK